MGLIGIQIPGSILLMGKKNCGNYLNNSFLKNLAIPGQISFY
jgi:hypothetical protein